MKHRTSLMAVVALILVFSGAISVQPARAEPELRFEFFQNISEPQILDVDTISAWGTNASSLFHYGVARAAPCRESAEKWDIMCRLSLLIPVYFIDSATSITVHEYGHFRAYSRLGINEFVMVRVGDGQEEPATPWGVFWLALRAHTRGNSLGEEYMASIPQREWAEVEMREPFHSYPLESRLFIEAGGLNQSQHTAERIARDADKGTAHPLDGIIYLFLASGTAGYGNLNGAGDIVDYVNLLHQMGINTSLSDIRNKSQLPKLLSGSFLAFAFEGLDWVMTGDEEVNPLSFRAGQFRFFWPEFASYLTAFGPTVKVSKELRWEEAGLAFSFLLQGEKSLSDLSLAEDGEPLSTTVRAHLREYTAGIGVERGGFATELRSTKNKDMGGAWHEASVSYREKRSFAIGVAGYYGKGYSFAREVKGQIPYFAQNEEHGVKLFFELSFPY